MSAAKRPGRLTFWVLMAVTAGTVALAWVAVHAGAALEGRAMRGEKVPPPYPGVLQDYTPSKFWSLDERKEHGA